MGLSTATLEQLAHCAPIAAEDGLPPLVSLGDGETIWEVGRWDEANKPGPILKYVIRLINFIWGENLSPQRRERIATCTDEQKAKALCLDRTYFYHPMVLNRALPRERVTIAGVRFPKRHLHQLWWHGPPTASIDPYVPVKESEVERLRNLEKRIVGLARIGR